MDAKKLIEALQFFATGLTEGALVHKLQGHIFKAVRPNLMITRQSQL